MENDSVKRNPGTGFARHGVAERATGLIVANNHSLLFGPIKTSSVSLFSLLPRTLCLFVALLFFFFLFFFRRTRHVHEHGFTRARNVH